MTKIAIYSHNIVYYLFWGYFFFFVSNYKSLTVHYSFIMCIILGLYLGYKFALWAVKKTKT